MKLAEIDAEIEKLSVEERLELIGKIWKTIADDPNQAPVDPEHMKLVREELARYEADGLRGERARDVVEQIRKAL